MSTGIQDKKTRLLADYRYQRVVKRVNRTLQITMAVTLGILLNIIAAKQFTRTYIGDAKNSMLSPESLSHLSGLKDSVEVYILMSNANKNEETRAIYNDIDTLLDNINHATRGNAEHKLNSKFIDVYRQPKLTRELAVKYGIDTPGTILLVSGKRQRKINGTELYKRNKDNKLVFAGEAVFMEAILDVSSDEQLKVYFIEGHGEMEPYSIHPAKGLSAMANLLRERNVITDIVNLSKTGDVPEDANVVIIAAPSVPFELYEVAILLRYLNERGGRLLVLAHPGTTLGLDELFYDWGILMEDRIVIEVDGSYQQQSGNTLLRNYAEHPITQFLIDENLPLKAGLCREVRPDPGARTDETLVVTTLIASSGPIMKDEKLVYRSWAETEWKGAVGEEYRFDSLFDLPGPVGIAVLAERKAGSDLAVDIPEGKLFVMGNPDLFSNDLLTHLGNRVFVLNTVNYLLERTNALDVAPRPLPEYQLTLGNMELNRIRLWFCAIPLGISILGILILYARRR